MGTYYENIKPDLDSNSVPNDCRQRFNQYIRTLMNRSLKYCEYVDMFFVIDY